MVKEYMNNKNVDQAVSAAKEMKPPKHFLAEMLNKMVVYSLDRSDEDREHTSTLIHALCTEGMVTGEHLLQVCTVAVNILHHKSIFCHLCMRWTYGCFVLLPLQGICGHFGPVSQD